MELLCISKDKMKIRIIEARVKDDDTPDSKPFMSEMEVCRR